jgi:hypothetical protein
MTEDRIGIDWEVFDQEGGPAFGAVRQIDTKYLVVYVENAGDVRIESEYISAVHDNKVLVDCEQLPESIREQIRHAHDRERT